MGNYFLDIKYIIILGNGIPFNLRENVSDIEIYKYIWNEVFFIFLLDPNVSIKAKRGERRSCGELW